jgi:hypothetical protein
VKQIFEISWTRAQHLGLCVYSEQESLSQSMKVLYETLMHPTECGDLLDHVTDTIPSSWSVSEDHQRRKSGWSIERTFELFAVDADRSIATILTYRDSHGGIAIELIADKGVESDLGHALGAYFSQVPRSEETDQPDRETVH